MKFPSPYGEVVIVTVREVPINTRHPRFPSPYGEVVIVTFIMNTFIHYYYVVSVPLRGSGHCYSPPCKALCIKGSDSYLRARAGKHRQIAFCNIFLV